MSRARAYVRAARWTALGAILIALGWAVAPALSLERYAPEPVNFEQAIPKAAELGSLQARRSPAATAPVVGGVDEDEGPVTYLTGPIAAPARFDLVGLVGHRKPVELRVRKAEDAWSRWVETSDGEPVWTGGADEIQLRSRDTRPAGELAYVNVSGTATGGERALNSVRGAVNSGVVTVGTLLVGSTARAEAPFEIVSRKSWDPNEDCVPRTPAYGQVRAAVVHHTVNTNTYGQEDAPRMVLGICRYHRYSHGWNDIGYNALVDRFGNIYAGRAGGLDRAVVGAHTAGFNSQTTGVASLGTHTSDGMSKKALRAMARLLSWKFQVHDLEPKGKTRLISSGGSGNKHPSGKRVKTRKITRHRRFNQTSCPGRAQVKKIFKRVKRRVARGRDQPIEPGEEEQAEDSYGGVAAS